MSVRKISTIETTAEMEKLHRQGKTYQQIADIYGIIKQAVQARFARAGIKRRPLKHQTISKIRLEKIYAKSDLRIAEIALKLNSTPDSIRAALKFYGIPKRAPLRLGGVYADPLRELECGQSTTIRIAGKSPQARLHRSAASLGIKVSVRSIGDENFRVHRIR